MNQGPSERGAGERPPGSARIAWAAGGAAAGGIILGSFGFQPAWAWGMGGGVAGGLLGYAAAWIADRPWQLPARIAVIVVVLGLGFFSLWMLASARFLVDWVLGVQGA